MSLNKPLLNVMVTFPFNIAAFERPDAMRTSGSGDTTPARLINEGLFSARHSYNCRGLSPRMEDIVKTRLTLFLLALLLIAGVAYLQRGSQQSPQQGWIAPEVDEEQYPDEWFVQQRISGGGVPPGALERAAAQADRMDARARVQNRAAAAWSFVGPPNVGGRVLDVAVDPVIQNSVYVAAASGGVWISRDAGKTFSPLWPSSSPQPIGALAISPQGVLFAGTGEATPGGGSLTYGGAGIYRSTNRGKSWQAVGLSASSTIGRLVVDPKDSKRIFAAAAGSHYIPGGDRGVYLSEDGGLTWRLVLKGANPTTGALDLAVDGENSDRIFATMWDRRRQPDLRTYGGPGSGVYFSSNGGSTWKRLGNGLPPSSKNLARIGIAIAPSDSKRMYAIAVATNGTLLGFYRSTSGGATWSKADHTFVTQSQATYGWWFGRVWVDPRDANHVFLAGVQLIESTDGGQSWNVEYQAMIDQHAMAWDPHVRDRVYLGNDNGVFRSDTNGNLWQVSSRQPFTQFYGMDVAETNPALVVGGTQDNGSVRSYPTAWNTYYGGDGQQNLINYRDPKIVYACISWGSCVYSTDGGERFTRLEGMSSTRRNWFTPLQFDPNDPSIMYFGGNTLDRSTDGGRTWRAISGDLTGGPGRDKVYPYGTMTTVAPAKSNGNIIYIGTDDGRIWYTRNLGSSWTRAQDSDIPGHWVTRLAVDPSDADIAYATFSGYRSGADKSYVLQTIDGGRTWANITGNLPQAPVNDIIVTASTLYVGTDVGVYLTRNRGVTWDVAGTALPRSPVTDLRLHAPTNTLYAATFGRGIYKLKVGG